MYEHPIKRGFSGNWAFPTCEAETANYEYCVETRRSPDVEALPGVRPSLVWRGWPGDEKANPGTWPGLR